jgi:hypothetical protein
LSHFVSPIFQFACAEIFSGDDGAVIYFSRAEARLNGVFNSRSRCDDDHAFSSRTTRDVAHARCSRISTRGKIVSIVSREENFGRSAEHQNFSSAD